MQKRQLKGGGVYFGSQFQEDKVCHGGEDMATGKDGMVAEQEEAGIHAHEADSAQKSG